MPVEVDAVRAVEVPTRLVHGPGALARLGESTRFLRQHGSWLTRALRPGGFSPDPLIAGFEESLLDPERKVAGFHIFTFNDMADTERWRQQTLERHRNER